MIAQSRMRILLAVVVVSGIVSGCGSSPSQPHAGWRAAASTTSGGVADRAVDVALSQVGTPYRYGGAGPSGFDCSGLVHYSYREAGKLLPRTTGQLWDDTVSVGRADLRAGDLLFFRIDGKMQHVGLYVGNGQFVHAPSSGRRVSVASLSSDFYAHAFLRGGRPR